MSDWQEQATLTTSAVGIFQSPVNEISSVGYAIATNTTANARTVTIHIAQDGGAAATGNIVVQTFPVPPNDTVRLPVTGAKVDRGAILYALCDANSAVNINLGGTTRIQTVNAGSIG